MENIMRFLIKIAAVALAVWVTTMIVPGIQVSAGLRNYLVIALILALINATLGTLLKILTLPLAFLSLGISLLVVNTAMLLITDRLSESLTITGFWSAFFGAILISIISSMITQITTKKV
ncbi:MAG: phage holin family protein [Actinobacteria bacterium]|nr:phage holin family protein [Actinomycetota bacterium]